LSISDKSERALSIDELLQRNVYDVDDEPHIIVDTEKCLKCRVKPCTLLCPAGCYTLSPDGEILFSYEGCVECGTCRSICPMDAITWNYPRSGRGIYYRFT